MLEYVIAFTAMLVVVWAMWFLVSAVFRASDRTTALVRMDVP